MMQTLNPYPSKTDEIMSRYRPIAPKPTPNHGGSSGGGAGGPLVPEKLRQSPYFRSIWSHLQARPTRTRKRGRSANFLTPTNFVRRQQQEQQHFNMGQPKYIGLPHAAGAHSSPSTLNFQYNSFAMHANHCMASENNCPPPITLPLLTCEGVGEIKKGIDLNSTVDTDEKDKGLFLQLSTSPSFSSSSSSSPSPFSQNGVISPRPVRPVGSTITVVGPISDNLTAPPPELLRAGELEAAWEADALPMVILDRKSKVRMANSAYKELVGQPECPWLESMVSSSSTRISGEIQVHLPDPTRIPCSGNGFSCWVRIEWESDGKKKLVNAFSEALKLACESKDYHFSWRFHIREISPSSS